MRSVPVLASVILLLAASWPSATRAEMWCADPLWVHEWGVQVFGASMGARTPGPSLPRWFHAQPGTPNAVGAPVRDMPVDGGMRELPVVHFYSPSTWRPVPLGVQVGFLHGEATRWYPQVDDRRSGADANGAHARRGREALLAARSARTGRGFEAAPMSPLGRDPTRQLSWDHLVLESSPRHSRRTTPISWVRALRGFDSALWINGAHESERFLFYEGRTSETAAVRIERGPTYAAGRRHYLLRNTASHPIHDVFVVHRQGNDTFLFRAPSIPPGSYAGFLLEEHRVDARSASTEARVALRELMIDSQETAPPSGSNWRADGCVMQRDPAAAVEASAGHRLYAHEADAILDLWAARFFDAPRTTILYREDGAYLDEVMPLSLHTDMFHYVVPRRLGLALMENVALPSAP